MTAFVNPTRRVLHSDVWREMARRGWGWSTPYAMADLLCVIHGTSVGALGLSWGIAPATAAKVREMEAGVPTIDLLIALGYGSRRAALCERLGRRRRARP